MVYLSKAAEWSKKQDHLFLFTLWLVAELLVGGRNLVNGSIFMQHPTPAPLRSQYQ